MRPDGAAEAMALYELLTLAGALDGYGFTVQEPSLTSIAKWAAWGLSAYDASYVALAEQIGASLVTTDAEILALASSVARRP